MDEISIIRDLGFGLASLAILAWVVVSMIRKNVNPASSKESSSSIKNELAEFRLEHRDIKNGIDNIQKAIERLTKNG